MKSVTAAFNEIPADKKATVRSGEDMRRYTGRDSTDQYLGNCQVKNWGCEDYFSSCFQEFKVS